jgi:hypothetical protein
MTVAFPTFARLAGGVLKDWVPRRRPLPGPGGDGCALAVTTGVWPGHSAGTMPLRDGSSSDDGRRGLPRCTNNVQGQQPSAQLPCSNKDLQHNTHFFFGFVFDFAFLGLG